MTKKHKKTENSIIKEECEYQCNSCLKVVKGFIENKIVGLCPDCLEKMDNSIQKEDV